MRMYIPTPLSSEGAGELTILPLMTLLVG